MGVRLDRFDGPRGRRRGSLIRDRSHLVTEPRLRRVPFEPIAPGQGRTGIERHGEPGWYEWTLREFLRYFFWIGVLALVVFVPLQMQQSWLPDTGPPALDPTLVGLIALVAVVGIGLLAVVAYRMLWGEDGWVERRIAGHRAATRSPDGDEGPRSPPWQ